MFYKKNYVSGLIGLKGNPSIANRAMGAVKYAGVELLKNYTNNVVKPAVSNAVSNYLEKL